MGIDKTILIYSSAVVAAQGFSGEVVNRAKKVFLDTTTSLWDALVVWLGLYDEAFKEMALDVCLLQKDSEKRFPLQKALQSKLLELKEGHLVTRCVVSQSAIQLWNRAFIRIAELRRSVKQDEEAHSVLEEVHQKLKNFSTACIQDMMNSEINRFSSKREGSFDEVEIQIGDATYQVPQFYTQDYPRFSDTYVSVEGQQPQFFCGAVKNKEAAEVGIALHQKIHLLGRNDDCLTPVLYLMSSQSPKNALGAFLMVEMLDLLKDRDFSFSIKSHKLIIKQKSDQLEVTVELYPILTSNTSDDSVFTHPVSLTYHLTESNGQWSVESTTYQVHADPSTLASSMLQAQVCSIFQTPTSEKSGDEPRS